MMSSFASVLVANANATPENVVPCSESACVFHIHVSHLQNQYRRSTAPCSYPHLQPRQVSHADQIVASVVKLVVATVGHNLHRHIRVVAVRLVEVHIAQCLSEEDGEPFVAVLEAWGSWVYQQHYCTYNWEGDRVFVDSLR